MAAKNISLSAKQVWELLHFGWHEGYQAGRDGGDGPKKLSTGFEGLVKAHTKMNSKEEPLFKELHRQGFK